VAVTAVDVAIRPVEHRDLDAIVDMIGGLAVHHGDVPNITAEQLTAEALGPCPSIRILVAETDGQLVGHVMLQLHFVALHGTKLANIDQLFVITERRGQGIGRRLMDAALDAARILGCNGLQIQATPYNWAAHSVYTAFGFELMPGAARQFWRST
jgi:GNAT superfamily N-acetyltransferase